MQSSFAVAGINRRDHIIMKESGYPAATKQAEPTINGSEPVVNGPTRPSRTRKFDKEEAALIETIKAK